MSSLVRFSVLFGLMLVCWWALSEGDNQAWWFGVPLALIAAGLMWRFWPKSRFGFTNVLTLLPKIIGFFLWQSWRGGWDVAKRALSKNAGVNPVVIDYALSLPIGWRRDIWLATIGLMPGTLAVAIEGNLAKVHVLDKALDVQPGLVAFERLLLAWR